MERLVVLFGRVIEVTQLEPVVVVPAVLLDAENVGVSETADVRLVSLLVEKVERGPTELVRLQVKYCDAGPMVLSSIRTQVPFLSGLYHDTLPVAHHPERVHRLRENILEQYIAILVHMRHAVLP